MISRPSLVGALACLAQVPAQVYGFFEQLASKGDAWHRPYTFCLSLAAVVLFQQAALAQKNELLVCAAVSLKETLQSAAADFQRLHPDTKILFNFAASGQLEKQLEQGASADVFVSASPIQMDQLEKAKLVKRQDVKKLAKNRLVVIVPQGQQCVKTLEELDKRQRVSIGDPKLVPAGTYAREALQHAGIYDHLNQQHKLIFGESVRQVLLYVEGANVDAGIVYATDAADAKGVNVCLKIPESVTEPILYVIAPLIESHNYGLSEEFVRFLLSPKEQRMLASKGFTTIP